MDTRPAARPGGTAAVTPGAEPPDGAAHPLPSRRLLAAAFAAFAVYAGLMIITRHADGTWGVWACGGYAAAALLLLTRAGWVVPLAVALGGALVGPLLWLVTTYPPTGEIVVIGQSARYLLHHGTPYLPASLVTSWTSYNPYLPAMEVFGLPREAGLGRVLGDPRIWTTVSTVIASGAAFAAAGPHRLRGCRDCRHRVAWCTAVAVASPLIALPLAVGVTDPPVLALTCLALAWADRDRLLRAAVAIGVACAMKSTAWAVVPVLAAMAWTRHGPRAAARLTAAAVVTTAVLALAAAPRALADLQAVTQNLIAYPANTARFKTVAASPLPGHLIAQLGWGGRLAVDALVVLAVVAFAVWVIARPPRDARAAAVRLAAGYAALFTLDPSSRYGYYAYPLALIGWLALTNFLARPGDGPEAG